MEILPSERHLHKKRILRSLRSLPNRPIVLWLGLQHSRHTFSFRRSGTIHPTRSTPHVACVQLRVGVLVTGPDDEPVLRVLPTIEYHLPAESPIRSSSNKVSQDPTTGAITGFASVQRSCPADVDSVLWAKVEAGAKKAHVALGCRDYSLYDVRVSPEGEIAFLEASLYCSFAPRSIIVQMSEATGEARLQHIPLFISLVERAAERKVAVSADGHGDGLVQNLGMKQQPTKARISSTDQPAYGIVG